MPLIREKVKFTNQNMNFKFTLDSNDNFTGYQQEIDNLTQVVGIDVVNPAVDAEVRRFKMNPSPNASITLTFIFAPIPSSYFTDIGFTSDEIKYNDSNVQNSFFVMDFYDKFDINSQTKIFTTYLTKIGTAAIYSIGATANSQLYYWNIPLSYIQAQTGTTVNGYAKFSFFNAKTGALLLFNNTSNLGLSTAERIFFKAQLNLTNMTWKFVNPTYPAISATQIPNTVSYVTKINNTYEKIPDMAQTYPSGNTYNYINNDYIIS
jgi:hypothetical protein